MTQVRRNVIEIPPGYSSREAASFLAQMDDLSHRLTLDTRGLAIEELAWQAAPGMNTIGMLLAHNAIVEVYWTCRGIEGLAEVPCFTLLGIGDDDDGMPLAAGGAPPATLAGRELAFFDGLLAAARARLRDAARPLTDADLDREQTRVHSAGSAQTVNVRWLLYHMLEHYAGHYAQVLLLRRQYRAAHPHA